MWVLHCCMKLTWFCPCSELLGTEDRWPWLLGFNGFTALLQLFTLPFLPESPSFLLLDRGDRQACEKGASIHLLLQGILWTFKFVILCLLWCSVVWSLIKSAASSCSPIAIKRLWGNKDYSKEVEEMLQEKAALQSVRSLSVIELIQNQTVRWQLLTILVTFTTLQLCGINAVSDMSYTQCCLAVWGNVYCTLGWNAFFLHNLTFHFFF